MFPDKMYRVFESEWKWLYSKLMLPDVFESDPVTLFQHPTEHPWFQEAFQPIPRILNTSLLAPQSE